MAFRQPQERNTNAEASWKAQGFLNLYLPTNEGKRVKLGAIPLKDSKHNEKQLLSWLNEDPSRAAKLLAKLEIEFKSAEPKEGAGLALPD